MKNDRPGDWLWNEWDGDGYEPSSSMAIVYATYGEVDTTDDIVRRALASALQRDGVAQSLGHGFKMIENVTTVQGYSGIVQEEDRMSVCSSDGVTDFGDEVSETLVATWVEVLPTD